MKTKIVPSLNGQSFSEIIKKINLLKIKTKHFHLDVADLDFTNYKTWNNPDDLDKLEKNIYFDLHLMIKLSARKINKWFKLNIKRFIIHQENNKNVFDMIQLFKKNKREVYLVWPPEVDFEEINKYLSLIDGVLVLAVKPGRAGQKFLDETYEKLKIIRKRLTKKQKLMVDGGVNKDNFKKVLSYRPDYLIMSSAIYDTDDPKETYQNFKQIIKMRLKN